MLSFFPWTRPEIAIDFGTANLRVIRRGDGIVFDEPSLCCFADMDSTPSLFAAGSAAEAMVDRTTGSLAVKRPLCRGVLQDIGAATHLLRYAVPRALGRTKMIGANVVFGVPADATQAERQALHTAARDAGLGSVRLVSEPFAAAVGAELPIFNATGTMIVDCGAGTTEVAVLSLGGICLTQSVRIGGAALSTSIADQLHFKHKFMIGERTAEQVKQAYALRGALDCDETIEIKGRCLKTLAPGTLHLPLRELDGVIQKHASRIVNIVRDVLGTTPPELSHDILENGIVLTGGAATTPCLKAMIEAETQLSVIIAEEPERCVAKGLHHILMN